MYRLYKLSNKIRNTTSLEQINFIFKKGESLYYQKYSTRAVGYLS